MSIDPRLLPPDHPEYDPFGKPEKLPERTFRGRGFKRPVSRPLADQLFDLAEGKDPEKTGIGPSKAKKAPDHNIRTRDYFEKHGYLFARCEWWVSNYEGTQFKKDLYGLFDGLAVKDGSVYGIQIGGTDQTKAKLRDLCSAETKAGLKGTNEERLKAWLDQGGKVLVICWAQPGGRLWEETLTEVTAQTILEVASRRRKVA